MPELTVYDLSMDEASEVRGRAWGCAVKAPALATKANKKVIERMFVFVKVVVVVLWSRAVWYGIPEMIDYAKRW